MNMDKKVALLGAVEEMGQKMVEQMPKKVSDLTNDAGYQTGEQVAAAVAATDHLTRRIVESVETIDATAEDADRCIYMVPKGAGKSGNRYDEYMILDGELEKVGSTEVNLEGYARTDEVVAREDGKGLSTNDYTDEDKAKLDGIEIASDEDVAAMLAKIFGS